MKEFCCWRVYINLVAESSLIVFEENDTFHSQIVPFLLQRVELSLIVFGQIIFWWSRRDGIDKSHCFRVHTLIHSFHDLCASAHSSSFYIFLLFVCLLFIFKKQRVVQVTQATECSETTWLYSPPSSILLMQAWSCSDRTKKWHVSWQPWIEPEQLVNSIGSAVMDGVLDPWCSAKS